MPWEQAVRIFIFGLSGVFITLGVLVIAIIILGKVAKIFQ